MKLRDSSPTPQELYCVHITDSLENRFDMSCEGSYHRSQESNFGYELYVSFKASYRSDEVVTVLFLTQIMFS